MSVMALRRLRLSSPTRFILSLGSFELLIAGSLELVEQKRGSAQNADDEVIDNGGRDWNAHFVEENVDVMARPVQEVP